MSVNIFEQPLGTYKDLQRLTGLARGTLKNMVSNGLIPHIRLGPQSPRFVMVDCDHKLSIPRWLREKAVPCELKTEGKGGENEAKLGF